MSWIKVRDDLATDPAVAAIASRCSVTACHVVGALVTVWAWAGRLSEDGTVPLATPALLDFVAHTPGLAAAMEEAGWLEIKERYLLFPKWDRHNSDGAKQRALNAERVRRHRVSRERDAPVTVGRYQRRGEEKRIEEPPVSPCGGAPPRVVKVSKPEDVPLPDRINTPELRAAYLEWCAHRRQRAPKDPWTPIAARRKLVELERLGPAEALRWITFALDNGLKNIQRPFDLDSHGRNSTSSAHVERSHQQTLKDLGLA